MRVGRGVVVGARGGQWGERLGRGAVGECRVRGSGRGCLRDEGGVGGRELWIDLDWKGDGSRSERVEVG